MVVVNTEQKIARNICKVIVYKEEGEHKVQAKLEEDCEHF